MIVLKNDNSFFCDVDDTLILWSKNGHTWKPHKAHIELLKRAKIREQLVVVWSLGGYEWAYEAVRLLKLEKYVDLVISKPKWWVDDKLAHEVLLKDGHIFLDDSKKSKYSKRLVSKRKRRK